MIRLITQASLFSNRVSTSRPVTFGGMGLLFDGSSSLKHSPNLPGNVFWLDPTSLYKQGSNFKLGISASSISTGSSSPVEIKLYRQVDSKVAYKVDKDATLVTKLNSLASSVLTANLDNAEIDLLEYVPLIVFTFTGSNPGQVNLNVL